ncbi:unnamed protein product [Protopolystoma xenopodis]|uniref:Uncharacterized protein n=1 Tax=Protopolystoma xenopodis TaxID=117903 RepID=A0A448XR01_9PLAT|nr:unnamed protein product [Protopolystoma xenopodis]
MYVSVCAQTCYAVGKANGRNRRRRCRRWQRGLFLEAEGEALHPATRIHFRRQATGMLRRQPRMAPSLASSVQNVLSIDATSLRTSKTLEC